MVYLNLFFGPIDLNLSPVEGECRVGSETSVLFTSLSRCMSDRTRPGLFAEFYAPTIPANVSVVVLCHSNVSLMSGLQQNTANTQFHIV